MNTYVKFHHNRSFHLYETELYAVGRCKCGYVQQSVLSKSRTDLDQGTTLVLLRLCHNVCFSEVSSQQVFSSLKKQR